MVAYWFLPNVIGVFIPLLILLQGVLTLLNLRRMLNRLDNVRYVHRFVQRISMPLHVLLQAVLAIGALLCQMNLDQLGRHAHLLIAKEELSRESAVIMQSLKPRYR
jgi:hypothetical protein